MKKDKVRINNETPETMIRQIRVISPLAWISLGVVAFFLTSAFVSAANLHIRDYSSPYHFFYSSDTNELLLVVNEKNASVFEVGKSITFSSLYSTEFGGEISIPSFTTKIAQIEKQSYADPSSVEPDVVCTIHSETVKDLQENVSYVGKVILDDYTPMDYIFKG